MLYFCIAVPVIPLPDKVLVKNPGFLFLSMSEKELLEKVFSTQRMSRYFALYPHDDARAILHYKENLKVASALYTSLSVFEVTLRNALSREMSIYTGRSDWYSIFDVEESLSELRYDIQSAKSHISNRGEKITPDKIVSELTFGFWVTMLNSEYELTLWKPLRKAFPFMPKVLRKRKNVSAPCNTFRKLRNRIFHHESICWDLNYVATIHNRIVEVLGWMDKDLPTWLATIDDFDQVEANVKREMGWR